MLAGMNPQELRERALHSDDDLGDAIAILLTRADQRQMWLLFIDEEGRLGDPLMPMNDYPDDPLGTTWAEDLGEVGQAQLLMHRCGMLREALGHRSIVLVWERRGAETIEDAERAWARAMDDEARRLGVPLRAQFLLHDRGVRQLHLDDCL